ncbi:formate dehydrogenase subunit gamma [Ammoniphilus sp. CFH 90114]|uniref:formate dehydrogenase subunit gamma n=1 Tax=Ammoniphilus sp. CFH 90114 TaxID=2493665 RepID=UPI00100E9208|nr:cytochrome b/b6 domain-containing protein [Ammoniphilus sp. CFH 90114]RXT08184.1 cytochrome b/b6 domain-containing protein [Ammoniphilus sp. CFH 90114]
MNKKEKIKRHSFSNRFVHWFAALSIFTLIISGIGQLPFYKRYNVTKLPYSEWLGDYFSTLYLHYLGAILLLFVVVYHIVFHVLRREYDIVPRRGDLKESYQIIKAMITRGKEPPSDKYLAEQRLAYVFIGLSILVLVVTGIIKIIKNMSGLNIPFEVIAWSTHLHNLATVTLIVGILGHLAAFIVKENRHLIPGMFSGYVDADYIKKRHSIWYSKLLKKDKNGLSD